MFKSTVVITLTALLSTVFFGAHHAFGEAVVYVDDDASANGDGATWNTAFRDLQNALDLAGTNGAVLEIRVAAGTYTPSRRTNPADARSATFSLRNGIALRGGYAGIAAADPDDRNVAAHVSILTGDLAGDDGPLPMESFVACYGGNAWAPPPGCEGFDTDQNGRVDEYDGAALLASFGYGENTYHVVTGHETDLTAVLDGFSVTAGNAESSALNDWENRGAGLLIESGSATIKSCTFYRNHALLGGGASTLIWSFPSDNVLALTGCRFRGNSAFKAGNTNEGRGGGIFASGPLMVKDCSFDSNLATSAGGALSCNSRGAINSCTFTGNVAIDGGGGAVHADNVSGGSFSATACNFLHNRTTNSGGAFLSIAFSPTLINCLFVGNSASRRGGGFASRSAQCCDDCLDDSPRLINCSFIGNSAKFGGGFSYESMNFCYEPGRPRLTNCSFSANIAMIGRAITWKVDSYSYSNSLVANSILWDGGDEVGTEDTIPVVISYSNVRAGWPGTGNIDAQPRFVDVDGADGIPGTQDDDLRLLADSPCIEAGYDDVDTDANSSGVQPLPSTDLDGNPRVHGCHVDLGAYEYQGDTHMLGDADDDCDIDLADYGDFEMCLSFSGPNGQPPSPSCLWAFDWDDSGSVDFWDFAQFQAAFVGSPQ